MYICAFCGNSVENLSNPCTCGARANLDIPLGKCGPTWEKKLTAEESADDPDFPPKNMQQLIETLGALSDNAYIEYINSCRAERCLGEAAKLGTEHFGAPELAAHRLASEWLGKHRGYARAQDLLRKAYEQELLQKAPAA
jgi:hypothetical protein